MKINNAFLVSYSNDNVNRVINIGLNTVAKTKLASSVFFGNPEVKDFEEASKSLENFNENALIGEDPYVETLTKESSEWLTIQKVVNGITNNTQIKKLKAPNYRFIVLEEIKQYGYLLHIIPIERGAKIVNKSFSWRIVGAVLGSVGTNTEDVVAEFDDKPFINLNFKIITTVQVVLDDEEKIIKSMTQFVYCVNEHQYAFKLHEINQEKAKRNLENFANNIANYSISKENYSVEVKDYQKIFARVKDEARTVNRLAKYSGGAKDFGLAKIKQANNLLAAKDRVSIDDDNKKIVVDEHCIGTFTALIHNLLLQRLISGDIEIPFKNY